MWFESCVTISSALTSRAFLAVTSSARVPPLGICWCCRKIPLPARPPVLLRDPSLTGWPVQTSVQASASHLSVDFHSGRISFWLFWKVFIETGCLLLKSHESYLVWCKCAGKLRTKIGTARIHHTSIKRNPLNIILPLCYDMNSPEGLCFVTWFSLWLI